MANVNAPFGFRPCKHLSGAPWNGLTKMYYIPGTDTTSVFIGDIVKIAGNADSSTGVATVTVATAGDTLSILGAVVGFDPALGVTPNLNISYRPASTAMYTYVVVDPTVVYEVQASGTISATDIGLNISLTAGGGGSTTNGVSSFAVDSTTKATTNTLQFHLLNLARRPNNAFGASAIVEVSPNITAYATNFQGQ